MNIKETKLVTKDDIEDDDICYEYVDESDEDDDFDRKLPDASDILDNVLHILQYMATDEMMELKKTNKELFEQLMEEKFQDFSFNYYALFKQIISGDDISPLFKMLEVISNVNSGRTDLKSGESDVGMYLSKFLPENLKRK